MKNNELRFFEKVKKIEIVYPDKNAFVFYNDILDQIKVKINDIELDISNFNLSSIRYHKQVRFETSLFEWLENNMYIKNFSKCCENLLLPADSYCNSNEIEFKRTYKS